MDAPPWLGEVFRVLVWGSQSGWFGVACPAHCTFSVTLGLSIFCSGLGFGIVLSLLACWYLLHPLPVHPNSPVHLASQVVSSHSRIAAYVHERFVILVECDVGLHNYEASIAS